MKRVLISMTLLSLVGLSSCQRIGTKVDAAMLPPLVKGQTTCHDIIAAIGKAPTSEQKESNGSRQVVYSFTQSTINPEAFIPVVGGLMTRPTITGTGWLFACDQRDVLIEYKQEDKRL